MRVYHNTQTIFGCLCGITTQVDMTQLTQCSTSLAISEILHYSSKLKHKSKHEDRCDVYVTKYIKVRS